MNDSKISVRYAKALLQAATEQHCEDAVRDDMVSLIECVNASSEFMALIESPVIADSKKVEIFGQLFQGSCHKLTLDFFGVLVDNKRENFLKIICMDYLEFYAKRKNIKRVSITSVAPLATEVSEQIKNLVVASGAATVELSQKINSDIIGGIIVQIDDKVYDASVKSQLARIKENLK